VKLEGPGKKDGRMDGRVLKMDRPNAEKWVDIAETMEANVFFLSRKMTTF
jgi:hypothetical protein